MKKLIELIIVYFLNSFIRKLDYNTWIFSSNYNNTYDYNSRYLFEHIINIDSNISPLFIINDRETRSRLSKIYGSEYFIGSKTLKDKIKILKSGVWLFSAGLPLFSVNLNKGGNRLIINLWHGIPLKRIGLLENNISFIRKKLFKYFFSENYTHILTTSTNLIDIMSNSFGVKKDIIKVWGQPRNDALFKKQDNRIINNFFNDLPQFNKLILYAPTFRDNGKTSLFPFEDFNLKNFEKFLEDENIILLIRTHLFEERVADKYLGQRIRLFNSDMIEDVMEVLNVFDILITDYSSMYIDFLLLDMPIIFLPYDKAEYLSTRGLNFDYNEVTPGPKPKNYVEFKKEISKSLNNLSYYSKPRKNINEFFNQKNEPVSESIIKEIVAIIERRF